MKKISITPKDAASGFLKRIPSGLVFFTFLLFSFWLMFHTFSYDSITSSMLIATKAWSDFGAHIPLIRSFSLGDNWTKLGQGQAPEYPLFPEEPIRYHFLFYAVVGALERLGLRIDWALNLPSALGFFLLIAMIYSLAMTLFKDKRVAWLAIIFFLFNGSLSFIQFFAQHPLGLSSVSEILSNQVFPAFAPWGKGDITAFWNLNIYTNQRHLSLSFAMALAYLYLALKVMDLPWKKQFPWAIASGILLGLYPFLHQPTLLILAIFAGSYFLFFPKLRKYLFLSVAVAALLISPQLRLLAVGKGNISWYPGYLIHDQLSFSRFCVYWWRNLGLHFFLIPLGFLIASRKIKLATLPIFLVFVVANLFKFSVEVAASHKFFNFFLILGNMISAFVVLRLMQQCNNITIKQLRLPLKLVASAGLIGILTLSGIIDFFAVKNDVKGRVIDLPANRAATWIRDNTPPSAVFLNSSYFFHPASLAGRKIFFGWPYFPWSAGYTENRSVIIKTVYESKNPAIFCPLLRKRNLGYITIEDNHGDPDLPVIDLAYFRSFFYPIYEDARLQYAIFQTTDLCRRQSP